MGEIFSFDICDDDGEYDHADVIDDDGNDDDNNDDDGNSDDDNCGVNLGEFII